MKQPMNLGSAPSIAAVAPGLEAKTYGKVDRRLLPFLFLCYILAYLDRVNMGFAKLQMLQDLSLRRWLSAPVRGYSSPAIFCLRFPATSC